jgi:hypothetical protein
MRGCVDLEPGLRSPAVPWRRRCIHRPPSTPRGQVPCASSSMVLAPRLALTAGCGMLYRQADLPGQPARESPTSTNWPKAWTSARSWRCSGFALRRRSPSPRSRGTTSPTAAHRAAWARPTIKTLTVFFAKRQLQKWGGEYFARQDKELGPTCARASATCRRTRRRRGQRQAVICRKAWNPAFSAGAIALACFGSTNPAAAAIRCGRLRAAPASGSARTPWRGVNHPARCLQGCRTRLAPAPGIAQRRAFGQPRPSSCRNVAAPPVRSRCAARTLLRAAVGGAHEVVDHAVGQPLEADRRTPGPSSLFFGLVARASACTLHADSSERMELPAPVQLLERPVLELHVVCGCGALSVFSVVNHVRSEPSPRSRRATTRVSSRSRMSADSHQSKRRGYAAMSFTEREHAGRRMLDEGAACDGGLGRGSRTGAASARMPAKNKQAAKDKGKPAARARPAGKRTRRRPRRPSRSTSAPSTNTTWSRRSKPAWRCRAGN